MQRIKPSNGLNEVRILKKNKEKEKALKAQKKEYEKYVSQFTPRSDWLGNCIKAFFVGGAVCLGAFLIQGWIQNTFGVENKTAGTIVTVGLIFIAQLLTGLGVFDVIAKFAGAGVIVPITGFANSMVATAMEFKYEGPVLGVGSKMFTLAGPVLVCGISASAVIGIIYYILNCFNVTVPWM